MLGVIHEHDEAYIRHALRVAEQSTCTRARCGAVLVADDTVIGEGYNSPPAHDESQRRCTHDKTRYATKVTDKTCCIHAEQRAILDALKKHADGVMGATLYFARVYPDGALMRIGDGAKSSALYCTLCTKLMYEVGVSRFVLQHIDGLVAYDKSEYLQLSYDYVQE